MKKYKKSKEGLKIESNSLLSRINSPADLRELSIEQLNELAKEIREYLVNNISRTGGHLSANLGVVELTLALHYTFNTPVDKIVWDVGHQTYIHKLITGRRDRFHSLRKLGGLSGFPKTNESVYDCFNTGHSSTSISAALGFARARDLKGEKYNVIAVIGDGAMTGGMAFEALNDAGRSPNNLIVILNDNDMSISRNVGGLSRYLSKIRIAPFYYNVKGDIDVILSKIPAVGKKAVKALNRVKGTIKYLIMPGIIFEELGFKYLGPIDGHNIAELNGVLSKAKAQKGPVLVHVVTKKGKGYIPAETNPDVFHGVSPFEVETGEVLKPNGSDYSSVFGKELIKLAEKKPNLVAITAAMRHGTGLGEFSKTYRNRFFDVGIAEQHAVTLAAGLARGGMLPVVAIYSSFLQRSYDQILHDVALQNLHVVFAIDRAGVVGEDGETHQGIFDISFLSHIPNMAVLAPCDYTEFRKMLEFAVLEYKGPIAIRYPKGQGREILTLFNEIEFGKASVIQKGKDVTLVAAGDMVETALLAGKMLGEKGISADIINLRFIKPVDKNAILESISKTGNLVTLEDNTVIGGLGSLVLKTVTEASVKVNTKILGFPDKFIEHGSKGELLKKYGLDSEAICNKIIDMINPGKII